MPILNCNINGEPVLVKQSDIASYLEDPTFNKILPIYNYTKLWGLPNGCGWANEPIDVLSGITALELEARTIEQESMGGKNGKSNGSTASNGFRSH